MAMRLKQITEETKSGKGEDTANFMDYLEVLENQLDALGIKHDGLGVLRKAGANLIKAGYKFSSRSVVVTLEGEFSNGIFKVGFPRAQFFNHDMKHGASFQYANKSVQPSEFDNRPFFVPSFGALQSINLTKVQKLYEQRINIEQELKAMS
jgi:hypothetical protein